MSRHFIPFFLYFCASFVSTLLRHLKNEIIFMHFICIFLLTLYTLSSSILICYM